MCPAAPSPPVADKVLRTDRREQKRYIHAAATAAAVDRLFQHICVKLFIITIIMSLKNFHIIMLCVWRHSNDDVFPGRMSVMNGRYCSHCAGACANLSETLGGGGVGG